MSTDKKKDPDFNYLLPPEECDMVYRILGQKPELDPCGHPDQFMQADRIMYGDPDNDDGMTDPWSRTAKKVFLNPSNGDKRPEHEDLNFKWYPFKQWMMKAHAESQRGVTILAFLPATPDRLWFHQYMPSVASICFLQKRIQCMLPDLNGGPPIRKMQPSMPHMYALWTRDFDISERFYAELAPRGFVAEPSPPPASGESESAA